jgi:hypothetical protein
MNNSYYMSTDLISIQIIRLMYNKYPESVASHI